MLMRKLLFILVLMVCFGKCYLYAQDSTYKKLPTTWTLQNCLDYADKNNYELNTLRLSSQTDSQTLLLAKAAVLPGVSGSTTQSLTNSKNANPVVGGFQTEANFASDYSISSSWTVYNGGYLKDNINQKKLALQSDNLSIVQQEDNNILQITQAYLNVLLAKENIVYLQDLAKTSQAEVDQGQQEFDAGSIAKNDLLQLQAQLATDKYNVVAAQNLQRQDILTLKQILLLPSNIPFDIVEPDTLIAITLVPPLDSVQNTALATRPEVKNSELGVQIAQLDVAKAKAEFLPTATVGGLLATGYSDNQSSNYLEQLDNNFYQEIGITLSVPIFTKRENKTALEQSKIEVAQANLTLNNTKITLSQTVEQAYVNVLNAQSQYDAAVVEVQATQESYRVATEELKAGAVNIVGMLEQKILYTQALQEYLQAKYSAALYIRIYDFYNGTPIKL